jgi:hypothetical protein
MNFVEPPAAAGDKEILARSPPIAAGTDAPFRRMKDIVQRLCAPLGKRAYPDRDLQRAPLDG